MKKLFMTIAVALILLSAGIGIGTAVAVPSEKVDSEIFYVGDTSMLAIYEKDGHNLVMVLPGPSEFEVDGNQLLVHGEVLIDDISGLTYKQYPKQVVSQYVPYPGQDVPTIEELGLRDFNASDLPLNIHWAKVSAFNIGAEKPITLVRDWQGQEWQVDAYVALSAKDAYLAGDIEIGDYVLVCFVDGRAGQALVIDGVWKSW